jgi:acylphosphatase
MDSVSTVSKHIVVRGRVQGVGYRAFVENAALQVGVGGWVRNRRDGSVEAVLSGQPEHVELMIAACRKGPFVARVTDIEERGARDDELALTRRGEVFSLLPTI